MWRVSLLYCIFTPFDMSKLLIFQATTYRCAHSGASHFFHLKGDSLSQGNKTEAHEKKMFVEEVVDGEGGDCSQSDEEVIHLNDKSEASSIEKRASR